MRIIKIRYRLSSCYMILSLLISMFALFDGISVYREYLDGLDAKKACSYPHEVRYAVNGVDSVNREVLESFGILGEYDKLNVKMTDILVKSNNSEYSWPLTIVLASNIPERIWLTDSTQYIADERLETGVLAGRKRYACASVTDAGRYLYLENQDSFAVTGEIGMEGSAFLDGMLLMSIKLMPQKWDGLFAESAGVCVWLQSEDAISDDIINSTTQILLDAFPGASVEAAWSHVSSEKDVAMEYSQLPLPVWLYIFCCMILIQVSVFWITAHKKEIMVRKICGYSDKDIFFSVLKELLGLMVISLAIYLCLDMAFRHTSFAAVIRKAHIQEAGVYAAYLVMTVVVSTALPTLWIKRWSCTELLNEKQV